MADSHKIAEARCGKCTHLSPYLWHRLVDGKGVLGGSLYKSHEHLVLLWEGKMVVWIKLGLLFQALGTDENIEGRKTDRCEDLGLIDIDKLEV